MTLQIAIDGPAASGKSTVAKLLAARLNGLYVNTGEMYRAVAAAAYKLNINPEKNPQELVKHLPIEIHLITDHFPIDSPFEDQFGGIAMITGTGKHNIGVYLNHFSAFDADTENKRYQSFIGNRLNTDGGGI